MGCPVRSREDFLRRLVELGELDRRVARFGLDVAEEDPDTQRSIREAQRRGEARRDAFIRDYAPCDRDDEVEEHAEHAEHDRETLNELEGMLEAVGGDLVDAVRSLVNASGQMLEDHAEAVRRRREGPVLPDVPEPETTCDGVAMTPPSGTIGRWSVLARSPDRIQVGCTTLTGEQWLSDVGERLSERENLLSWERAGIRALIEGAMADLSWWSPKEGQ